MVKKGYETASPEIYDLLKKYAKSHRQEMTESEKVLWNALRDNIQGYRFRRQHAIGNYIADFACLPARLVIEVDGGYHDSPQQQEIDNIRTDYLKGQGFHVVRFTNEEVLGNTDETLTVISNALKYLPLEGGIEGGCWFVSGDHIQAVHMLPGYTHNIINLSETEDLVTVMYCNEVFDPGRPDTFFEKV